MATLLDLAERMRNLNKSLPEQLSTLTAKAALVITYDLTDVTPVDTSRALSNWQVRIGSPAKQSIFPYYPGRGGSTESESEQYANYNALQAIKNKKPGQPIFITNNVEYVQDLDEGSSTQEPAGFVERAVLKGRVYIKSVGLNTNRLVSGYVDRNFGVGD